MKCPKCGEGELRSKLALETEENDIYRKRVCDKCGAVVHTVEYEVVETPRFKNEWYNLYLEYRSVYIEKQKEKRHERKKSGR